jgi:hypothetical protein
VRSDGSTSESTLDIFTKSISVKGSLIFKNSNELKGKEILTKSGGAAFRKSEFRKIKTLGQGSEGVVDMVEHIPSEKIFAIKV